LPEDNKDRRLEEGSGVKVMGIGDQSFGVYAKVFSKGIYVLNIKGFPELV